MSRIGSTIAAALVASPLFIAAPGRAQTVMPAPAPQTEAMPDSVPLPKPNQFTLGCALYSNTLTLMGQMHLHGSLVLTPQQLASVGAEGILYAGHARVVSHTPKGQESGSKLNLEGKEKIISWTLNDKTIEAGTPPVTIQTNVDACTYLGNLALQVSNASHVPVYSLFEEATAFATEKAVPADTHSGYSPGVEADSMREEMRGEFAGVGMTVSKTPGSPLVAEKVMKDSPSAKAGILDGDKITDIDGESILPMNSQEAVNLLRGPKDSKVKLTVQRGDGAPFTVDVTRDIVVQRSVEGFLLEGSDIGVIKIANFMNEKTTDQLLETAVDIAMQAHKQGKVIRHFVIRVEENPGGLITQGELVSDLFVNSDPRGGNKKGSFLQENLPMIWMRLFLPIMFFLLIYISILKASFRQKLVFNLLP
ncbi:MAG: PDZ domain-containing protein [Alphaproteobacteria bacterium]|nr:PDZ domain-containing protein [Alphaproteobacteria bacterium]